MFPPKTHVYLDFLVKYLLSGASLQGIFVNCTITRKSLEYFAATRPILPLSSPHIAHWLHHHPLIFMNIITIIAPSPSPLPSPSPSPSPSFAFSTSSPHLGLKSAFTVSDCSILMTWLEAWRTNIAVIAIDIIILSFRKICL